MSFSPNPGVVGSQVAIAVTSAFGNPDVVLQVFRDGSGVDAQWVGVDTGAGKGYIWRWTMTPLQAGTYNADFYIFSSKLCTTNVLQVNAVAAPTNTPVATNTPGPTATRVPTAIPPTATKTPIVSPTLAPPPTKVPTVPAKP